MKLLRCCKLNVLQWRIQPKYFLCVVFLALHMWNLLHGLNDYATALGYRIHPWIFPFLPDTNWNFTVMLLLFVLMICDAPFRNGQQQFVLLRVGKQRWIAAQLLYLLFLSVLFTVFLWVLSWVFLWPNLEWAGDWGKVLQTAARTGAHGDYANVILSPQMIKGTTPAVVTVWTGCMMIGVCFLLGEVVLLCNLWCQKGLGTAIAVGLVIVHSVIRMFSYFRYYHVWTWLSPVSWMDYSLMGHTNQNMPSYAYGIGMVLGLSILLGTLSIATVHQCKIDAE